MMEGLVHTLKEILVGEFVVLFGMIVVLFRPRSGRVPREQLFVLLSPSLISSPSESSEECRSNSGRAPRRIPAQHPRRPKAHQMIPEEHPLGPGSGLIASYQYEKAPGGLRRAPFRILKAVSGLIGLFQYDPPRTARLGPTAPDIPPWGGSPGHAPTRLKGKSHCIPVTRQAAAP